MDSDDSLPTLKILLIGPSGAGKSALLIRYCDDLFDSESSTATIGVDFKLKKLSVRGNPYRLNLLDTAGQERFRTLSNSYYRGAHGVVLVYDISSRDSFLTMERWFEEAEANAIPGVVTYLVGSKSDRAPKSRAVQPSEGQALAEKHGAAGFCEVSAKTRENVRKPFVEIVSEIVQRPDLISAATGAKRGVTGGATGGGGILNLGGGEGASTSSQHLSRTHYRRAQRQVRTFVSPTWGSSVQSLHASRTLSYPKSSLYDIIADVDSYSTFLPYCQESRVTSWSGPDRDGKRWPRKAELKVGWAGVEEQFTSQVFCAPEADTVEAVCGEAVTTIPRGEMAHYYDQDESAHAQPLPPSTSPTASPQLASTDPTMDASSNPSTSNPLFTHLLTSWTLRSFPYKPPPTSPASSPSSSSSSSSTSSNAAAEDSAPAPDSATTHPAREQCEVGLAIEFQFVNPVYSALSKAVAPKVAGMMIEAFENRAKQLLDGQGIAGVHAASGLDGIFSTRGSARG
ncbi:MAG: hypothetical protein M1837_000296 [Sclerophora amabilis]|nr:MAG: hypothetical protein M1837_000296 [Sclerophora amabilis]